MKEMDQKLHVEALKTRFKAYKTIAVKDFYTFYADVYGDIKKSTVHWYIYELKKQRVIRNVSRGLYVLEEENSATNSSYMVVTLDIVKSSTYDPQTFDATLKAQVNALNAAIEATFETERHYHVSQGDELQLLMPLRPDIGRLLLLTFSYLQPYEARYAIGIGEVDGAIKENSWEMNGPIFWNARDQLAELKKSAHYDGRVATGYSHTDSVCNGVLPVVHKALEKITDKQWAAMRYALENVEPSAAYQALKISRSSYYERLSSANMEELLEAYSALYTLVTARKAVG